jgi:CRP/FNR family transcriptional regulator, anaerobic regulatory protein
MIKDYLKQNFESFEPALLEKIEQNASIKVFEPGEILMTTGQYFRSTLLVVEGRIKLYREGPDGGEFFMYYIEPGSACALSMICAAKKEVSEIMAKAEEKTKVITFPIELMDDMIRNYKTWYYFVLETYRSRFEELLVVIDHIAFKGMDERLDFYLRNQYEKLQIRELKITHNQIASDLNSSREVISRLLKKMEQRGDLILHRNYIEWLK